MKKYISILLFLLSISLTVGAIPKPVKKTKQTIKVACVGNSITFGSMLSNPSTESYPTKLQELLGSEYKVENFGHPGATLLSQGHNPYVKCEEYQKALSFAADIAIIHLGVNDTDPRNWPNYRDEFLQDYYALIDSFKLANPACRVLIARTTPLSHRHWRFESGTRDWQEYVNKCIELVAEIKHVQLIDFYEPLLPYDYWLTDAVHPNKEGHEMLARLAYEAITGDYGGLQMSCMYTDHMVLQQGCPLFISGLANTGETVKLSIDGKSYETKTLLNGHWQIKIAPLKPGGSYTLKIATDRKSLEYTDVLAGEVWLCSGQSNMLFTLQQAMTATRDISKSADNNLRLYEFNGQWNTSPESWSLGALDSINHLQYFSRDTWHAASPENVGCFSAIAYYFGRALQDSLQMPVGIICNAVGGAPAESYIDRRTLQQEFPAILRDWRKNDFIQQWVRERASQNLANAKDEYQRHPYEPCYLFEAGILPLEKFAIKGVIWYQGESNAHNMEAHEKLFPLLVKSWRHYWNNDSLPFYYVQLSSLNRPSWPWFRDSQRRLLHSLPNLGMVVSSDWGDSLDVHPRNKMPIGERLTRLTLSQTYHHALLPSGPLYREAHVEGNVVVVSFDYGQGLTTSDGSPVRTFEIAGRDEIFYPAEVTLNQNGTVRLESPKVMSPVWVRYGWQPFTRANLVNEAGLPASTFRSERIENE